MLILLKEHLVDWAKEGISILNVGVIWIAENIHRSQKKKTYNVM